MSKGKKTQESKCTPQNRYLNSTVDYSEYGVKTMALLSFIDLLKNSGVKVIDIFFTER